MIFSLFEIFFFVFHSRRYSATPFSFSSPPHIFSPVSGRKRNKESSGVRRQTDSAIESDQGKKRNLQIQPNTTKRKGGRKGRLRRGSEEGRIHAIGTKIIFFYFIFLGGICVYTYFNRSTIVFSTTEGFDFQQRPDLFFCPLPSHGLPSFFLPPCDGFFLPVSLFPFFPSFCGNQFSSSFPWRPPKNILATSASVVVFSFSPLFCGKARVVYIIKDGDLGGLSSSPARQT